MIFFLLIVETTDVSRKNILLYANVMTYVYLNLRYLDQFLKYVTYVKTICFALNNLGNESYNIGYLT